MADRIAMMLDDELLARSRSYMQATSLEEENMHVDTRPNAEMIEPTSGPAPHLPGLSQPVPFHPAKQHPSLDPDANPKLNTEDHRPGALPRQRRRSRVDSERERIPQAEPGIKSRDVSARYPGFRHPLDENVWTPYRFLRFISFVWVNPIMRLGAKRQLEPDDLFPTPHRDESYHLASTLEEAWQEQLAKPNGNLFNAYVKAFWKHFALATFLLFIEAMLQVLEPWLLGRLINATANGDGDDVAFGYAGGLVASVLA
ncbi:uncharacterized protein MONBRDRAFT_12298 [Monosiga brevicollis MX1]|uniref:ABC transmembrane type-1 domain-containing protein n=1 Tax=Monosiga brevicollis TaxID=81824 RepID=A9VBU5_MONBE|nr:uncharacterized protein MONBRDRAFT_12298 [Monosiga brevicollis MX1]EDQ84993.1 predicted protein [Monosiga brevicollis MX1]|eukprot:XP_001750163.1 hypothetical protein [Monosiga brevicollis MX1]